MPSESAAGWSCVAWYGAWSLPVAAATLASAGDDMPALPVNHPFRESSAAERFQSLPVSQIIVFHN